MINNSDSSKQDMDTLKSSVNTVPEMEKSKTHIIVEIIEYVPNSIVSKTIIKKTTGNVTVSSFDEGEELAEKITIRQLHSNN